MRPKVPADLTLAPVAAEIDLNLQPLRDEPPEHAEIRIDTTKLDPEAAAEEIVQWLDGGIDPAI